jgi:hypothetical protein
MLETQAYTTALCIKELERRGEQHGDMSWLLVRGMISPHDLLCYVAVERSLRERHVFVILDRN